MFAFYEGCYLQNAASIVIILKTESYTFSAP